MSNTLTTKLASVLCSLMLLAVLFPAGASASNKTVVSERGSWLQWSKNYVQWEYNYKKRVDWSNAWQRTGAAFGNFVTRDGIRRYYSGTKDHRWRGDNTFGAKLGDYVLWSYSFSDTILVNSAGGSCINCPGY